MFVTRMKTAVLALAGAALIGFGCSADQPPAEKSPPAEKPQLAEKPQKAVKPQRTEISQADAAATADAFRNLLAKLAPAEKPQLAEKLQPEEKSQPAEIPNRTEQTSEKPQTAEEPQTAEKPPVAKTTEGPASPSPKSEKAALPLSFDKMQALIKPAAGEAAWDSIPWEFNVQEARKEAAAKGKPIFVWSMSGEPLGNC
jgi:hypothetical protein